jgi:hypothetical protein
MTLLPKIPGASALRLSCPIIFTCSYRLVKPSSFLRPCACSKAGLPPHSGALACAGNAYFDHRLRPEEDPLPVFLYIFLNPYRANLVQSNQTWPGCFCAEDD